MTSNNRSIGRSSAGSLADEPGLNNPPPASPLGVPGGRVSKQMGGRNENLMGRRRYGSTIVVVLPVVIGG